MFYVYTGHDAYQEEDNIAPHDDHYVDHLETIVLICGRMRRDESALSNRSKAEGERIGDEN